MTDETGSSPVPRIPLNVRLRRHRGRHLAIGYEHALELSSTAVFIWSQIDGTTDVVDIARAVSDEYAIDTETALEDVRSLLDELVGHQLIVWETPSQSGRGGQ
ncbi:PqqD family protein [Streptomyces sp. NPDC059340]|uniref:PqqD family protein n=1 Tax=Streptomyces sp. NPDC059340 TaxID=3346806 RepID=UPI0036C630BE